MCHDWPSKNGEHFDNNFKRFLIGLALQNREYLFRLVIKTLMHILHIGTNNFLS
jgi:hypothetical protein